MVYFVVIDDPPIISCDTGCGRILEYKTRGGDYKEYISDYVLSWKILLYLCGQPYIDQVILLLLILSQLSALPTQPPIKTLCIIDQGNSVIISPGTI